MYRNIWLLFFGIFFISGTVFANDIKLEVEKTQISVDETFKLKISLSGDNSGDFEIKSLSGIEMFDIQSRSQSSSFSSINGNIFTSFDIVFLLQAKEKGTYTIGPVTIISQGKEKVSNSIKMNVTGEKMFLTSPASGNTPLQNHISSIQKGNTIDNHISNLQTNETSHTSLYFLLGVLLVLTVGVYVILKQFERKEITSTPLIASPNEKEISYTYPEVGEEDFIHKIESIFKQKIQQKYHIDTKAKHYQEIFQSTGDNNILEIAKILQKAKYSPLITDQSKILQMIQDFEDKRV